jgi:tRNA pseudouridine55 synthase
LARQGIHIERKPRRVTLFSLILIKLENDRFTFQVHCSKGTYIRTLVEDIGRELGCGAHVIALRRISVAPYGNSFMYTLPELVGIAESAGMEGLSACLLAVETAVSVFPAITLSSSLAYYLRMGQAVRVSLPLADSLDSQRVQLVSSQLLRLVSEDGKFLGIGEVTQDGRVKPHRLLAE